MANVSVLDVIKRAMAQGLLEQQGEVISGPGAQRDRQYFIDKLTSRQSDHVKRARKHATELSVKQVLAKQTIIQQQQQMMSFQMNMQKQQALALMCRVYVGSINFEVREDTVRTAFAPFGPIKSLSLPYDPVLQKHKGFSFIEYELPEAAQMAIDQMGNAMMAGRNIKVGRPTNMPQAQPIIEQLSREALKYNRIYLASVHSDLTNNDIQSVFESFGKVVSCEMVPDAARPGKHRGFGFIEYDNPQSCVDAINSMNLFDLGGQFIRVGRAVTPPGLVMPATVASGLPTAAAVAAAQVTAKLTALDALYQMQGIPPPSVGLSPQLSSMSASPMLMGSSPVLMGNSPVIGGGRSVAPPILMPTVASLPAPGVVAPVLATSNGAANGAVELTDAQKRLMEDDSAMSLEQQENMKISGTKARHLVMHKLMRRSESRVMVLRNMVGPEDVDETLEGEVTDECGRYGQVEKVIIYQERQGESEDAEVIVKIFVEFANPSEMEAAVKSLNGRFFGGRTVSAQAYEQSIYDANDLTQ